MSWTDERVETLKKMWGEGQSASQIAKELGSVTRNAVIGKVHRLGLSNRVGTGPVVPVPVPPSGHFSYEQYRAYAASKLKQPVRANRNTAPAEALAAAARARGLKATVLSADLSDPEAVERLADAV